MNPTNEAPEKLETETCTRCGGSGKYSYCQMYGDRCFKCAGSGKVLSKRGVAANKYLTELRSKLSTDIQVGDAIFNDGGHGGPKRGFYDVTEIRPCTLNEGLTYFVCGETFSRGIWVQYPELVRIRQTAEQSAATWAKAMAYQASLNKTGKPSKKTELLLAAA
jgi:hypothetical protein